jgi:N-acylglucosamine 2-epimerase
MNKELLKSQQEWIRGELEACANFWLKNGWDKENGGVYTCLDRWGKIYSTDKSVWMQGRCAWTFSYLCHVYGIKQVDGPIFLTLK